MPVHDADPCLYLPMALNNATPLKVCVAHILWPFQAIPFKRGQVVIPQTYLVCT